MTARHAVRHLRSQGVKIGLVKPGDLSAIPVREIPIEKGEPLALELAHFIDSVILPQVEVLVDVHAAGPDIFNQHTWTMRFDHRISDQDQVYVRLGLAPALCALVFLLGLKHGFDAVGKPAVRHIVPRAEL